MISIDVNDILENGVQLLHIFATFGKSWGHGANPGGSERTNGSKIGCEMKPDLDDFSTFLYSFGLRATKRLRDGTSSHLETKI